MSVYAIPDVYSAPGTLVTPAHTIAFNADTGDAYMHDSDKCSGIAIPVARAAIDDRPQTHGAIVHPALLGGRRVTLGGDILPRAGGFPSRNAMMVTLGEALVSILAADGTYSFTLDGATYTFTVRCEITASFTGKAIKSYLFGLVAADPTVTVT